MLWMLIRKSSTGSRIIPYYCQKPASKAPRSNWDKVWFEWMDFTSHYGGRTSLRLGYFRTLLWFPTTGTIISRCEYDCVLYDIWKHNSRSYLQYFLKPLLPKFWNITRLILGFDFAPQLSRQAVSTYSSGSGRYLCWMESPSIKLLGCDWTPGNLNLFNKF